MSALTASSPAATERYYWEQLQSDHQPKRGPRPQNPPDEDAGPLAPLSQAHAIELTLHPTASQEFLSVAINIVDDFSESSPQDPEEVDLMKQLIQLTVAAGMKVIRAREKVVAAAGVDDDAKLSAVTNQNGVFIVHFLGGKSLPLEGTVEKAVISAAQAMNLHRVAIAVADMGKAAEPPFERTEPVLWKTV